AGNVSNEPRGSQELYVCLRSRVTGEPRYRKIGMARAKPTKPLKSSAIFARKPRLVTSFDEGVIEYLQWTILYLKKAQAWNVALIAMQPHLTHPAATWDVREHCHASPARPILAVRRSQSSEDIDRLPD